jgi:hypothetical protein
MALFYYDDDGEAIAYSSSWTVYRGNSGGAFLFLSSSSTLSDLADYLLLPLVAVDATSWYDQTFHSCNAPNTTSGSIPSGCATFPFFHVFAPRNGMLMRLFFSTGNATITIQGPGRVSIIGDLCVSIFPFSLLSPLDTSLTSVPFAQQPRSTQLLLHLSSRRRYSPLQVAERQHSQYGRRRRRTQPYSLLN